MATSRLGSPPVSVPRAVTLAVLQQMANNIRERLERVESAVGGGPGASAGSAAAASSGGSASLQRQVSALQADMRRLDAAVAALAAGEGEAPGHDPAARAAIARLDKRLSALELEPA